MKQFLRVIYIKWFRHQCHRFCWRCKYKNECYDNLDEKNYFIEK